MASTNYTGRSVDLFIFQGALSAGEQQISLGFGTAGEVITGIQKLVQSFATLFLTRLGSVKYNSLLGSSFIASIQRGQIRNESDVRTEFALAVEDVRNILVTDAEANTPPDDETYASAELKEFELNKAASLLMLKVRVNSVAGESREVFLPVPLAIR